MTDDTTTNPVGDDDAHAIDPAGVDALAHDAQIGDALIGDEPAPPDADGDEVEIEHEGRRYRVPRPLRDSFLMHADYTRKTQELAEQRRALAEHQERFARHSAEHIQEHARLAALDQQLSGYAEIDWPAWRRLDREAAEDGWFDYQQLKEARDEVAGALHHREQARAVEQQRAIARQLEEGHAILGREIEGWSPELGARLLTFGEQTYGFDREELAGVTDPRIVKALYDAFTGRQALSRHAAAERFARQASARPPTQVGAQARATRTLDDRVGTDEWMRRRNEQTRRKAR